MLRNFNTYTVERDPEKEAAYARRMRLQRKIASRNKQTPYSVRRRKGRGWTEQYPSILLSNPTPYTRGYKYDHATHRISIILMRHRWKFMCRWGTSTGVATAFQVNKGITIQGGHAYEQVMKSAQDMPLKDSIKNVVWDDSGKVPEHVYDPNFKWGSSIQQDAKGMFWTYHTIVPAGQGEIKVPGGTPKLVLATFTNNNLEQGKDLDDEDAS